MFQQEPRGEMILIVRRLIVIAKAFSCDEQTGRRLS